MSSRTSAALAAAAVVVLTVGVGVVLRVTPGGPSRASVLASRPVAATAQAAALDALHAWDDDRAAAWAEGSTSRLADLYLPGSRAGSQDVHALEHYRRRGLVVTGMRTQVLDLAVIGHTPGRWRLRVTDRLAAATARRTRGPDGVLELPRDAASSSDVTLVRGDDGRWRVGAVTRVRPEPR